MADLPPPDASAWSTYGPLGSIVGLLSGAVFILFNALQRAWEGRLGDSKQHAADLRSAIDTLREARLDMAEGRREAR